MNNIKSVEVRWEDRSVGRLAMTREGLCAFEYSAEQLASGVSISPFELPLRTGVFIAQPSPFDGDSEFLAIACPTAGECWCSTAICRKKALIRVR